MATTVDEYGNIVGDDSIADYVDNTGSVVDHTDDPIFGIDDLGDDTTTGGSDVGDDTLNTGDYGYTTPIEVLNEAKPGEPGYGWKYYTNGTAISPDNKYYQEGKLVYDVNNPDAGELSKLLGKDVAASLKKFFVNADGTVNLAGLGTVGAGLLSAFGSKESGGYNKPVPKMTATREQVKYAEDPNRRPGSGGRQYFTDTTFTPTADTDSLVAAKAAAQEQAAGLRAAAPKATAEVNPWAGKIPTSWNPAAKTAVTPAAPATSAVPVDMMAGLQSARQNLTQQNDADYNIAKQKQEEADAAKNLTMQPATNLASGGIASAGHYLQGKTDGMADKISTTIDNKQPAALSHGEFVIPADVVSHLGNGNSDAGAEKLYQMMSRIRKARTGTTKQGKQINPDEFTMGGLAAAYAGGGSVMGFAGTDGSVVPAVDPTISPGVTPDKTTTGTLAPWVGDYATTALGQGAAMAAQPYQAYTGPLTAGESDLQKQAFAGASDIAAAGYEPGKFTGGFSPAVAQQYMNPYLQASLDPQLRELKRASDIARLGDAARLTKAGAFGGSRQGIMESEGRRNLLTEQADVLGKGYKTAYDVGQQQYAQDRGAEEASRQFGANFGLKSVQNLADLGAQQRGITGEGIAADKKQFEEQRDWQYQMPQYQLDLLKNLPTGASTTSTNQTAIDKAMSDISGLGALYKKLEALIPKTVG